MTILDYSKCEACKKLKNTKSIILSKILPEVLVDKIVSYDCCKYCSDMRAKEQENLFNKHLSKIGKQLHYFRRTRMSAFNEYGRSKKREMKALINIIEISNNPFKNVLKLYLRNCYSAISFCFCRIIENLYDKEWLKHYLSMYSNIPTMKYSFYNRRYDDKWLCKLTVYEYLNNLIFLDKKYIDNDELKNYLNDLFDDYNN